MIPERTGYRSNPESHFLRSERWTEIPVCKRVSEILDINFLLLLSTLRQQTWLESTHLFDRKVHLLYTLHQLKCLTSLWVLRSQTFGTTNSLCIHPEFVWYRDEKRWFGKYIYLLSNLFFFGIYVEVQGGSSTQITTASHDVAPNS